MFNKTGKDFAKIGGYNMHLGAIVASSDTQALISNMMEPTSEIVQKVKVETIEITSWNDLRSRNFGDDANSFALGLLKPSKF